MLPITLEIKTPEKNILHTKIKCIKLPGTDKPFEVRKNHLAIMSTLGKGEITYTDQNRKQSLQIEKGFVAVKKNHVTIILDPPYQLKAPPNQSNPDKQSVPTFR